MKAKKGVGGWPSLGWVAWIVCGMLNGGCASVGEAGAVKEETKALAQVSLEDSEYPSLLVVPVRFQGEEFGFVLDTGSTLTFYDIRFRDRLGPPVETQTARTASGITRMEAFVAPEAYLGTLPLHTGGLVGCIDLGPVRDAVRDASGKEIHGILGMDVLRQYVVRIDFESRKLSILDSSVSGRDDWGQPLPIEYKGKGVPTVTAALPGGMDAEFIVDTGDASIGDLRDDVYERLRLTGALAPGRRIACATGAGMRETEEGIVQTLQVGPFHNADVPLLKSTWNGLGLGYLSQYCVTFHFPEGVLYLKPRPVPALGSPQ